MTNTDAATRAISQALEQARLAYEFGANSYTHSAMSLVMAAEAALKSAHPDWISEFLSHLEQSK